MALADYVPALDFVGDLMNIHQGREAQYSAQRYGEREAEKQRSWQQYMSNTAYQRASADLQAAGINPMLAYMGHNTGASTPSGATAGGGAPPPHPIRPMSQSISTAAQLGVINAQAENIRADTKQKDAYTEEIIKRTGTHEVNIDRMRQEIAESVERVENIRQQVRTGVATAAHLNQMVFNLQETIPQIRASTAQLITLSKLNEAQAKERLTAAGLNEAQAKEIYQRLKQDLPSLQRELMALEKKIGDMSLPGHMADEAAKSSLIGQIGAYLKALLPLQGLMGAIPLGRGGAAAKPPAMIHQGSGNRPDIHRR